MKAQTYIAFLLVSVFVAKFIAVDADGLNTIFNKSKISFVNPYCKLKNSPKQSNRTADYSQIDHLATQSLVLNSLCTSPFELKLFAVEMDDIHPTAFFSTHFSSSLLSYLLIDNDSPPPKLA